MPATSTAPSGAGRSILIVAILCLASLGEGFDLQAPGVTLPVLAPLFKLTTGQGFVGGFMSQKSLFLSMSTFGLLFGAMIGGRASDLVGRKWVTAVSVGLFSVLSVITVQAASGEMLLYARFFTGLGLGGAYPSLIALAAENVAPSRRHTAVGFLYAAMPAGGALVSLSAFAFANPEHWRTIYYLGGLVPALALPGLIFGVPSVKPQADPLAKARPSLGLALFGEGRATRTVVLWFCFLFALITQYILLGWLPTLLISKGLPRPSASIVQMTFNVFGAAGSVVTGFLVDRPGRSASIGLMFLAGVIGLAVLALAPAGPGISLLVGAVVGFTNSATQAIVYGLSPGCYPARVRGTGVGFAVAVGRIGATAGPLLAGALIGAGAPAAVVLAVLVPLMTASGLCAWWISRGPGAADPAAASQAVPA
jgi:AAHS family 3-hydroxyphenylpropionic acid transporter